MNLYSISSNDLNYDIEKINEDKYIYYIYYIYLHLLTVGYFESINTNKILININHNFYKKELVDIVLLIKKYERKNKLNELLQ